MESDALEGVDRILKNDRAVSQEIRLVREIVRMMNRERHIQIQHISQNANKVVDYMAKKSIHASLDLFYFNALCNEPDVIRIVPN